MASKPANPKTKPPANDMDGLCRVIRDIFVSPNEVDSNWEPANLVDVVAKVARGIHRVAHFMETRQGQPGEHEGLPAALLPKPTITDPSTLDDLLLCIASTIEDSMIEGGARPGVDYSRLDLYKMAQPFALHMFQKPGNEIGFTVSWP